MPVTKKTSDSESKAHWEFVENTARRVEHWPSWKQAATTTVRVEPSRRDMPVSNSDREDER